MDDIYYDYDYDDDDEMQPDNEKLYCAATVLAQQYYKEFGDGVIDCFYSYDLPDMVAYLSVTEENQDIIPIVMQEIVLNIKDMLPVTNFYKGYSGKYTLTFMDLDDKLISIILF